MEGEDGFAIFIRAIPYNYYALLTIVMMFAIVLMKVDFGPMAVHEANAMKGDIYTSGKRLDEAVSSLKPNPKGKVIDLARRVLVFRSCMECIPEGFKAMVPAILILTFAWTLKAMTDSLGAADFVEMATESAAGSLMNFLPAIVFLIGCFLAFATGTSWGTFGILIPIVVKVFENSDPTLMIISISACMAGAVCGDHCSPISDTTGGCHQLCHIYCGGLCESALDPSAHRNPPFAGRPFPDQTETEINGKRRKWHCLINQNQEYLYILLLSLGCFEPIVSKLCLTNSHKMYEYS